jgi:hypothetical protein
VARILDGSGQGFGGSDSSQAPGGASPLLTLGEQAALARAPKRAGWRDIAGKIWNAPNTAIGAIYGGLGMGAGQLAHVFGGAPEPKVFWRDNAIQFINNPFGGVSAITLGNTTTWKDDPYGPPNDTWFMPDGSPKLEKGHTYPQHETQHTYQGQQLGPAYLPSNIAGGLTALLFDRDENGRPNWHGDHNWNERGPQSQNLTPWAPRSR